VTLGCESSWFPAGFDHRAKCLQIIGG